MKHLYAGFAIALLALSGPALAHDDHDGEERISHYEAPRPGTQAEAFALLKTKTGEIGAALEKKPLDGNALESIHERTYALEHAVDRLREDAKNDAQEKAVDTLDEAVQALHYASENHEEAVTREWFARLEPAIAIAEAGFGAK